MKKTFKLGLTLGVVAVAVWCIPPVRHAVYQKSFEFSRHYRQREREIREAVMPETAPLAP